MKETIEQLESLSRDEILSLRPGTWGDYDLLPALDHFEQGGDSPRYAAVIELILRSPQVSEMVDYSSLAFNLVEFYREEGKFTSALQWAYFILAFIEQHEDYPRDDFYLHQLADIYLDSGAVDLGLRIYREQIASRLTDPWVMESLGEWLAERGHVSLGEEIVDRARAGMEERGERPEESSWESADEDSGEGAPEVPVAIDRDLEQGLWEAVKAWEPPDAPDDEDIPYLPLVARLRESGPRKDEPLFVEIYEKGRALVPDLIRLAYDDGAEHGSDHAIAILREFHDAHSGELELLSGWLDRAEGNWRDEILSRTMGKVGGFYLDELKDIVEDRGYDVDVRLSALEALQKRAEMNPDRRQSALDFFSMMLARPEAGEPSEEEINAWTILSALDLDARDLYPEIKRVFEADWVAPHIVSLRDVHEEFQMPPPDEPERRSDGLYLTLECRDCGRVREHFTEYVLVELESLERQVEESDKGNYSPYILDHPVICPKCGSVDRYELTSFAQMRVLNTGSPARALDIEPGEDLELEDASPNVFCFRSSALGRAMHPLDALDEYRRRIALQPKNPDLHMRLGMLLRLILRYDEALKAHRRAYELDPNDPEIVFTRALTEHDLGDREAARDLYQKVVDMQSGMPSSVFQMQDSLKVDAVQGLRALKRGETSPWDGVLITLDGERVEHPSKKMSASPRGGVGSQSKKPKRGRRRKKK